MLATNQGDRELLPDAAMLSEYKGQSKTESGFKFIKDDTFEVSSIFLKKPERIAALMMVMTLCLMIYGVSQYNFREALAAAKDTIPNQLKKEVASPSMKWVYRLFYGVQVVTLTLKGLTQEIVINPVKNRDFFLKLPVEYYFLTAMTGLMLFVSAGRFNITGIH